MAARSEQSAEIANQFKQGEKLVAKGEKNIRSGNDLVEKGQNQVRDGISLQETSRRAFCEDVGYSEPVCQ
ncbi:MAG: hypothetical protein ACSHXI_20455 [Hoeflea sp.]|uniref:hypothetical protein n=1 Tax=Hoeflea sp. TaxID=1940281 RepID=UPI003EF0902A